ncbi:MAG TPA: MFS transporter [Acidimicrobiales bacterium]|nr:MFS transporter [Acidimicrobiales bacterium]
MTFVDQTGADQATGNRLARGWQNLSRATGNTGWMPLLILTALATVVGFDAGAFGILSPDIRSTFHMSTGSIDGIATLTGAVPIVFSVYLGYLGDKHNRLMLSAAFGILWGVTAIVTGLAPTILILILARLAGGVGQLTSETLYPSLLADYHPPEGLGVVFGVYRFAGQGLGLAGGPLAGLCAAIFGWRIAFVILAIPTFVFVALLWVLKEPERGVSLGLSMGTNALSLTEGFRRVRAIRTARRTWVAAFLFGAGTLPFTTLLNTYFKDVYHYGDTARGNLSVLYGLVGLGGVALGGVITQRLAAAGRFRLMPLAITGFIVEFAGGVALMAAIHNVWVSIAGVCILSIGAIGFITPYTTLVAIIAPPALRAQAYAWTLFWYALGAIGIQFFVIGPVINAHGQRVAMLLLAVLVAAGGLVGGTTSQFIEFDMEQARKQETAARAEALLHCAGVDAGYGGVQVLFGVDMEVKEGEIVALLGTNGAGKSTFLKAISGLLDPMAGVVYFDGQDITHTDPMATARMGIMQVPGGRGIFPTLTVADNLKVAGWMYRKDKAYIDQATRKVIEYFPILHTRSSTMAGDLSGGEQQMLSLAQAFIAQPKLLLIDELSLGLAPSIVARLLDIVRTVHAAGTTVILVEQSVNTALELAERAIFMEKGEVRFSGPTADLLDRPDILRAVFLQGAAVGDEDEAPQHGSSANGKAAGGRSSKARPASARQRAQASREIQARPAVLSTTGLSKRYGGVTAVDDVSIELHQGEILGLIGPNGAGKTTLFDLITGFSPSDTGRVVLNGRDVTALNAWQRAGLGLGRSFQDARLWPSLTVAESIAVALHDEAEIQAVLPALLGAPQVAESETDLADRVDELVELMSLGAFRSKFISELSTGSRRIVELACMLAHRPSVLLLDEPSSGIAQRETEALGPLLLRIREQLSCSVLIIEHDMPLITSLADHLVGLDLGRVVAYGTPQQVLEDPHVVESYLGTGSQLHIGGGGGNRPSANVRSSNGRSANGRSAGRNRSKTQ